jgi:Asp-tRNA(Asn)/Glu-tRNA(Gln) amidotransferase A subunit family amidase
MSADPATASAVDIAERVRTGEWSPVEVTEALLARIEKWEPHLNAFVDLDADGARQQARAAAEISALPVGAALLRLIEDYGEMRARLRAACGR